MAKKKQQTEKANTDLELLQKIQGWFETEMEVQEEWRREAQIDYDYVSGNQWSEADKQKLISQKRPPLTFNEILPIINLIFGIQDQQALDIKCYPVGVDDERLARAMSSLVKYAMIQTAADQVLGRGFDDGQISGVGWYGTSIDTQYTSDPMGDILLTRDHPFSMLWDSTAERYDRLDGEFVMKMSWIPAKQLKARYPQAKETAKIGDWLESRKVDKALLGVPAKIRDLMINEKRKQIRVLNVWYKQYTKAYLMMDSNSGYFMQHETMDEVEKQIEEVNKRYKENNVRPPTFEIIPVPSYKISYCPVTWWDLLDSPIASPYKHKFFPYCPLFAYEFNQGEHQGVVRSLRDPQDEINKRHSQFLNIINRITHTGWLRQKGSLSEAMVKQLREMGSSPGVDVEYTGQKPEQIQPPQIPSTYIDLANWGRNTIREISGVNAELVGQTTQVTVSGRAIEARQRGGIVILQRLMKNFASTKKYIGKQFVSNIQQFYSPEKIMRILGDLGHLGMENPLPGVSQDALIAQIIPQIKNIQFDVIVDLAGPTPSARQAQFNEALQMAQLGIPVPPQILIELSDVPHKEEILKEFQAKGMQLPMNPQAMNQLTNQRQNGGI